LQIFNFKEVKVVEKERYVMATSKTPVAVANGLRRIGDDLATWRKLRRLTVEQVADRAGISRYTIMRLENGGGATVENLLRVCRALGVLDLLVVALDPYRTDVGRLRSEEALPKRVRRPKAGEEQ
jgi:transcriptional regulator with XRE-family HTH domain